MTPSIEFNDKDKLEIEFIGSMLRINKFLVSKTIHSEVSSTADKIIYLTKKKKEIARLSFFKHKSGLFSKSYDLEIGILNPDDHNINYYKFYERKLSDLGTKGYDYNVVKFKDISSKTAFVLVTKIGLFIKNILGKKKINEKQSFKIWKETGVSSEEFVNNLFYHHGK